MIANTIIVPHTQNGSAYSGVSYCSKLLSYLNTNTGL